MAAESTFWKNANQSTIQLIDGTGSPVTLTLSTDQGNLKANGWGQYLNNVAIGQRRGRFGALQRSDRVFPILTLMCFMGNFIGGTTSAPGTPLEFMTAKGAYSGNVSTLGASRYYTFDLKLTVEGTNFGDSADETVTWEDCVLLPSETAENPDFNVASYNIQCLGQVLPVNNTNSSVAYTQVA